MSAPEGTPTIPDEARPRLGRGVRMRFDRARDRHVLLLPETVVVLNPSGAAILELCDGEHAVSDIVAALRGRYEGVPDDELAGQVRNYLVALIGRRHVEVRR